MESVLRFSPIRRRSRTFLLWLAVGLLAPLSSSDAQLFIRGDSNDNDSVSIPDAVFILNYFYSSGSAPVALDALDANDNGVAEIADSAYILRFLFDGGPPPPAPFPSLGTDSTPPTFPGAPSGSVTFELGDAQACPGDSVRLPFQLTTSDAIEALSFRLTYDPLYLTYDQVDDDPLFSLIGQAPGFLTVDATPGTLIGGLVFDLINPSSAALAPQSGTGVFDLLFTVAAITPVGTPLAVTLEDDANANPPAYNLVSILGEVERATMVSATVVAECPQLHLLRGDSNEDGFVSMSDAAFLVARLFLDGDASTCPRTNDVNGDNRVDLGDLIYLLNAIFGAGPIIPPPYPSCAADSLAGTVDCPTYPPCP